MIVNLSFNDRKVIRQIDELVGKPFGFFQSLRMGGTGSQRLLIQECSASLKDLFQLDNYPDHCNIELRPKGLIVHFRSRLEMYAWIVPAKSLQVSNQTESWKLAEGTEYVTVTGANNRLLDNSFLVRLKELTNL